MRRLKWISGVNEGIHVYRLNRENNEDDDGTLMNDLNMKL